MMGQIDETKIMPCGHKKNRSQSDDDFFRINDKITQSCGHTKKENPTK